MSRLDQEYFMERSRCGPYANNSPSDMSQNVKETLKKILKGRVARTKTISPPKSTVIETVKRPESEPEEPWNPMDKGLNNNTELTTYSKESAAGYGTFEPEFVDRTICDELTVLLHGCLVRAQQQQLKRRIMLPQDMLDRLAKDIVCMSRSEPYGLRGAVLFVNLESEESDPLNLGRIECNSHVVSTFEVHLTLVEDIKRWCTIKDLVFRGLFNCRETELYLSQGYKLSKKKLYRRNSADSQCC